MTRRLPCPSPKTASPEQICLVIPWRVTVTKLAPREPVQKPLVDVTPEATAPIEAHPHPPWGYNKDHPCLHSLRYESLLVIS